MLIRFVSNAILLQFSPERGLDTHPKHPTRVPGPGTACSSPRALLWSQCSTFKAVTACSREAQGGREFPVCWLPSPAAGRIPAGARAPGTISSLPPSPLFLRRGRMPCQPAGRAGEDWFTRWKPRQLSPQGRDSVLGRMVT